MYIHVHVSDIRQEFHHTILHEEANVQCTCMYVLDLDFLIIKADLFGFGSQIQKSPSYEGMNNNASAEKNTMRAAMGFVFVGWLEDWLVLGVWILEKSATYMCM